MAVAIYPFLEILIIIVIGLILGSFATAVTYREARDEKWFSLWGKGQSLWSKCPSCGAGLTLLDLIPVLSWVFSKGRCRHCGVKVSARYPLIEILSVLLCLGFYFAGGFTVSGFLLIALVPFLIALFFIDLDVMLLPNRLVAIVFTIAFVWVLWRAHILDWNTAFLINHLGAGLVLPVLFLITAFLVGAILKKDAIGMGDIKFLAPAGLLVGLTSIPAFLILSGALGVLSYVVIQLIKGTDKGKNYFPFGPSLIMAVYSIALYNSYIYQ